MKNVLAIIQARMGSTRFPGKVLADLNGKPLLLHCVDACKAAGVRCYVLTEDKKADAAIYEASLKSPGNFNGGFIEWATCHYTAMSQTEDSLLKSFLHLAENHRVRISGTENDYYEYDTIVRICADSPMVTPQRIRRAALAVQAGAGYCGFLDGTKPHPLSKRGDACEAFSIGTLRYEAEVATDPECHQHVTWGMYQPPSCHEDQRPYRRHWITLPTEPRYPAIDTPADLETLKAMLSKEAELVGS